METLRGTAFPRFREGRPSLCRLVSGVGEADTLQGPGLDPVFRLKHAAQRRDPGHRGGDGKDPGRPAVCLPGASAKSQGRGDGVRVHLCDKGRVAQGGLARREARLGRGTEPDSGPQARVRGSGARTLGRAASRRS